jgi:rare lipoprotein A
MRPNGIPSLARTISIVALAASLAACASHRGPSGDAAAYKASSLRPYSVRGHRYAPKLVDSFSEKGLASWYSYPKGTRRTATGEPFDPAGITAAHKTLPLPCIVEVTNLDNGKKLKVRVNDRGPFVDGRIIDLSRAAADRLGFGGKGVARVRVKFVGPARHAALETKENAPFAPVVMLAAQTGGPAGATPLT